MLGVVGAGTMGAGIAQVAALAGFETHLHDPFPDALERGLSSARTGFAKGAERGRWSHESASAAEQRLHAASAIQDLARCELVIEAVPEALELKRELFARLSEICGNDVLLATNTSSLPVTAMATAAARAENVVGMHFFNPAPLMDLVEVVAGTESSDEALATARAVGERMGKRVILAADGPGFLANRCARPFGLEALKLLGERVADHATIDGIVRMGGGFRMGPFELMDLVGIDVGFEVSKSFWEQSFHEPRWRPSPIQARMVQAGRHGRKAGRGYYDYQEAGEGGGKDYREPDPEPPSPGGEGRIAIAGESPLAAQLRDLASAVGYTVSRPAEAEGEVELEIVATAGPIAGGPVDEPTSGGVRATRRLVLCANASLAALEGGGRNVGFHALPPLSESRLVELTRGARTDDEATAAAESFFRSLGKHIEWVGDGPGLVLGRIVCQLVNEGSFAVAEGVGSAADVDAALELGFNYPRGPLGWGDEIGLGQVLATLDGLYRELHEERYRASPLLRRMVHEGRTGRAAGEGFFDYRG